jgi:hypothetical protein
MSIFLRTPLFLFLAWPLAALADNPAPMAAVPMAPAPKPSPAMVPAPMATPAFLDVVTFEFNADDESHKVTVTTSPTLWRVDEPNDGYSVIYDPQADYYTGLEHKNYTYWDFSWPEVRAAVENSKRHELRLQELGNQGLEEDNTSSDTNAPGSSSAGGDDDSGYVWQVTTDHKRIADLDCVRWTGSSVSGGNVEVWCYSGLLPKVLTAIDQLHKIDEPMALVPVRDIAPDFIFPVYAALTKGGVTPLLINWGDDENKNHFRLVEAKTRDAKMSLFMVPKLYMKTTLITMDGMIKEQPAPAPAKSKPQKTWQN